jgi:hypothetical protein
MITLLDLWDQRGNCEPILVTMRLQRILQLAVFDCCQFTLMPIRSVIAGIQGMIVISDDTVFRSTRNQSGNCTPILATVRLHGLLQLAIFVF